MGFMLIKTFWRMKKSLTIVNGLTFFVQDFASLRRQGTKSEEGFCSTSLPTFAALVRRTRRSDLLPISLLVFALGCIIFCSTRGLAYSCLAAFFNIHILQAWLSHRLLKRNYLQNHHLHDLPHPQGRLSRQRGPRNHRLGLQLHQQDQPHRQVDKVIISKDYSLFNKYLFSVKIDLSRSSLTSKCWNYQNTFSVIFKLDQTILQIV